MTVVKRSRPHTQNKSLFHKQEKQQEPTPNTMTVLKRSREEGEVEVLAMASSLMLLSRVGKPAESADHRVFPCKTCNREFPSFQALGGHRASHKKPRPVADGEFLQGSPAKQKIHECPKCGLEFPVGHALGGHMRRHRERCHHE